MRVVILRSNPVSPDSRVEKEAVSLLDAGFTVSIIGWERSGNFKEKIDFLDVSNYKIPRTLFGIKAEYGGGIKKNLFPLIRFQHAIIKWLFKHRDTYDVIHACDFDTAFMSSLAARTLNKKIVYDIFDYYTDAFNIPSILKNIVKKMDHFVINQADATIICSEKRKEQINGSHPKKLEIIHNSPPRYKTQRIFCEKREKLKIVYVGILGGGRMIKELCEIVATNKNYELHIAGFGNLEGKIREFANNYSNIIFYGKISYKEALKLENNCDVMTAIYDPNVPNHTYAAPNKFYESLMLGKPVIMIKDTGMSEIVVEHKLGPVIEYTYKGLENALQDIEKLENKNLSEISSKAQNLYNEYYSWNVMSKRLIKLYDEI